MGPEASVLHTRQVRDGWLGWLGRTHVEVTAGLRDEQQGIGQPTLSERFTAPRAFDPRSISLPATVPQSPGSAAATVYQGSFRIPPTLQEYLDELIRVGVASGVARRWVDAASSFTANLDEPAAPPAWFEQLQRAVARELKLAGPIRTQPGDRHVVALVGPTGVSKTTTIAKLAAGFRIEARRRVGLLTIDTFRIAAVQQLKAYAEIMDLPMEVVERVDEMRPALDRLGDVDLVLIDTAGRSPRSDARIEQLMELLRAAQPDETHLVLSATSSPSTVESVLAGFAPVRPTAAILTKLDEALQTAAVLAALSAAEPAVGGTPLSYVTNGQQVPDDIALANAEMLVSRLLPAKFAPAHFEAA